jgi:hypothetical protein
MGKESKSRSGGSGSPTSRIIYPRAKKLFFGFKILKFLDADPESF